MIKKPKEPETLRIIVDLEKKPSQVYIGPISFQERQDSISRFNKLPQSSTEKDFHRIKAEDLARILEADLTKGLTDQQVQDRLKKYGKNIIETKKESLILKLLGYLISGFCPILWICAVICVLAYEPFGSMGGQTPQTINLGIAGVLVIVALLQAVFGGIQDFQASKLFEKIKNLMPNNCTVLRDGKDLTIIASELVPGDIVYLTIGMKCPADIRLIETNDLKFSRALLTGESEDVEADHNISKTLFREAKNIGLMSTIVTNGRGKGIVFATGKETIFGTISMLTIQKDEEMTNMQKDIRRFVILFTSIAIGAAILLIIVWAAWLLKAHPNFLNGPELITNLIGLLVSFIPEGLPVAISLSLLIVAKKLSDNKILIKRLTIIETLGCVTVIASDKTGTITENQMSVVSIVTGNEEILDINRDDNKENANYNEILKIATLCNNAKKQDGGTYKGDATDIGLLKFVSDKIGNISKSYKKVAEIPFNSTNKWMMKTFETKSSNMPNHFSEIYIKGAPDILFPKCKSIIDNKGNIIPFTEEHLIDIVTIINKWCLKSLRVILLAKKIINREFTEILRNQSDASQIEDTIKKINDFCIVGIIGLYDPPRQGMKEVIQTVKNTGTRVMMITGDFQLTAVSIAKEVGLFSNDNYDKVINIKEEIIENNFDIIPFKERSLVLTGQDIEGLTDSNWIKVVKYKEIVFSRVSPEQKLQIVKAFQADKQIVAVTGDGVNDAPALKGAEVGIAMGSGSDLAMEAGSLILLDNNFAAILTAIKFGRLLFNNLRKVIIYAQTAGEFSEISPVFVNIFLGVPLPLSSFLMIVICILTDVPNELALIFEEPESDLLKLPPRDISDHLVNTPLMIHSYFFIGLYEAIVAHYLFFLYLKWYGGFDFNQVFLVYELWTDGYLGRSMNELTNLNNTGQSVYFVSLVMMQAFGCLFATRTLTVSILTNNPFKGPSRNCYLFGAITISIILMIIVLYLPPCQTYLGTSPVPAEFYFISIGFGIGIVILDEFRKLLKRFKILGFQNTI